MALVALYDACVLHDSLVRDLLIRVATKRVLLVRARWSQQILDEMVGSILERRPDIDPRRLARTRQLMCGAVPDCLVSGYESLIESMCLPDPGDRHVLAAAVKGGAEVIRRGRVDLFEVVEAGPLGPGSTERIGVAVSANRQTPLPAALSRHIVDRLLGADERDWAAELLEQSEKTTAAMKEQAEKGRRVVPGASPAHQLAEYAGRYEHPAYGGLEVEADRDAVSMRLGTLCFHVAHRHFETYDLRLPELGELGYTANFVTDESGSVSEVRCSFEPSVEPIRFKRTADARLADENFLQGLAGRYTVGPVTVDIAVETGPKLVGHQSGVRFELVPSGGMQFEVPAVPGLRLEFVLDSAGRATAIATSQGTLTPVD